MTLTNQPLFKALSDPTRRAILKQLSDRDMTIVEVTQNFDMTRAAVKKHLTILTDGGLVTVRPRGREKVNSLNPDGLRPLRDWLSFFDQFWDDRLDALKSAIEKEPK
jgi:DNA-binding transcriptional ArsR family regulator